MIHLAPDKDLSVCSSGHIIRTRPKWGTDPPMPLDPTPVPTHLSNLPKTSFYANATTLRSGFCYRKSVCRL